MLAKNCKKEHEQHETEPQTAALTLSVTLTPVIA